MKVACYCGTVYSFTYDGTCPDCGSEAFSTVQAHGESAYQFAQRMSEFVKTGIEIAALPEVER